MSATTPASASSRGRSPAAAAQTVAAAIWYCDLRGFTALSERLGRDALLACLNDYFDCMAGAVERQGGEILKFIGDAMLAIFPLAGEQACARALQAALDGRAAMAALNDGGASAATRRSASASPCMWAR